MKTPLLYRKRLIPDEMVLLKNDTLLYRDERTMITKWNTLRPKKTLHHGLSCYLLDEGVKISKFYTAQHEFICWYCDIVTHSYECTTDTYIFIDLLADVLIYPDGVVKVVDLDELADAIRDGLLTPDLFQAALRQLDWLLKMIYQGSFPELVKCLNQAEAANNTP